MQQFKSLLAATLVILAATSFAAAGDFDWVRDFNIQAQADPSGFRARIAARFRIGDLEVKSVIERVAKPADVYMVFRLGEMSKRPIDLVIKEYKTGKGWGVVAKNLGIKPGSEEFHALKRDHDLHAGGKSKSPDKEKAGHKEKEKDKNKGKGKNR